MPPGEGWWCKRALCSLLADETAKISSSSSSSSSSSRSIRNNRMGGSGEIVADKAAFESRYEFRKTLGDGGQGGVYMFQRKEDGAMVAVKEFGCLTAKEWRILSSVRHPHICSLVDRTRYENPRVRCTKLVMEIMDTSLQNYMLRGAKRDKFDPALDAFDVETARQLVLPLALALDYLHHKLVVHLDVKLDNVMIKLAPPEDGPGPMGRERAILRDPGSGRLVVKLADFGLAMLLGGDACDGRGFYASNAASSYMCIDTGGVGHNTAAEGFSFHNENSDKGNEEDGQQPEQWEQQWLPLPLTGKDSPPSSPGRARERRFPAVGTNKYMAPEVEFDSRFGVQADIFSLGVVLHVLLTGKFPRTGLNQPAAIDDGVPDVDGLRGLLEAMLHGDPYQRPHSFEVLDHPFLRPLRQPQDTLLGDLDDEAEQGGRVMLLQVRRGLLQQAQHQHQQEEPPTTPVLRGLPPPGTPSSSSSSSPLIMSPQLLAVQSEERPLEVYVAYMDLAEINDGRAAVVVCGRREGMKRVKKSEASTLGAILVRERAGSTTELGEVLDLSVSVQAEAKMKVDIDAIDGGGGGGEGEEAREQEEGGWPSVQQLVRKSGAPFGYVRSLWVALTSDRAALEKEAIWGIYQELRRLAPQLAAEPGTALYLPMTGCADRMEGFSSARAQRHAVIQESISLSTYLAEAIPSRQLESVVLYTWQKDAMHALMDFVRAHRADNHGMMAARLDDRTYRAYVAVLQSAANAADPALLGAGGGQGKEDGWLASMLAEMEGLDAYPAVCLACHAVGQRLAAGPLTVLAGGRAKARGALEVLAYNKEKVEWEVRERARQGEQTWRDMVGRYDTERSLHALLSLLRALEGSA